MTAFVWDNILPGDARRVLLGGIVGSTAYGFAGPESDVDRAGVYALRSELLFGLHRTSKSKHYPRTEHGDYTLHEAGRYAQLALGCNPSLLELLWLPNELYEVRDSWGDGLRGLRKCFLWRDRVRDAYMGYVTSQFTKLEARNDGSFSADTRKRTAKHARHLLRLCAQGLELYRRGDITVRVERPEEYVTFGARVAAGDIEHARATVARYESLFDETHSPLPLRPSERKVERWLIAVRYDCLHDSSR